MQSSSEGSKISKGSVNLIDSRYDSPNTILLNFHFEPYFFSFSNLRLSNSSIEQRSVDGKDVYIIDHFFSPSEASEIRAFSKTASFSRMIYGSAESQLEGERPAKAMNSKERWNFFASPPSAVTEILKLFSLLAYQMDADVATAPWDLCDSTTSSSAIATNFIEEMSPKSMELGKHRDSHPGNRLPFQIPQLYSSQQEYFPCQFENGAEGNPWIVSVMLYVTEDNFSPHFGMGTVFYNDQEELCFSVDCQHMRLVIFEGDIIHNIAQSHLPADTSTWRVSYVFKMIINPRKSNKSMKKVFNELVSCKFLQENKT